MRQPAPSPAPARERSLLVGAAFALPLLGLAVWWCSGAAAPSLSGLDAAWLAARTQEAQAWQAGAPLAFTLGYLLLFAAMAALALPGCSLLCLGAGVFFGPWLGTAVVVLGATLGACGPFLGARHLWRDAVERRGGERLAALRAALERDGAWVLFALRVAPVVPYSLVNPLMGLTRMPLARFFAVSALGMLASSAAYVMAGSAIGHAASWREVFTPGWVGALLALALLPLALRLGLRRAGLVRVPAGPAR